MLRGQLYVANRDSNNVAVIDATSLAVLQTIGVGGQPFGVTAAGDRVYVTNFEDGTLSIIDASSDIVIWTAWVGDSNSRYVVVCPILSFCESLKPSEIWCSESQDGHE
jgi:YVTN family beta-propeller protein